jgi:hypothetical protein
MRKEKICTLLAISLFFLASCTAKSGSKPNDLPGITIPIDEMNKAFIVEDLPVIANSHTNGKRLALVLRNQSDKTIVFPKDYGLKIFVFQNQAWSSVQNGFLYTGDENLLATSKAFPPGLMAIAYPYIRGLMEPTKIRIIMIGHNENSITEMVGAFIDITLLP